MIRRATSEDATWIRDVSGEVYAEFGDYSRIIPSWLAHPGVLTFVEEGEAGQRRGFILIGFYEPPDMPQAGYVADLLAIAVAPPFQRQGIGKNLLEYAIDLAVLAGQKVAVSEIHLTVAETNHVARRLFTRMGFVVLDEHHGAYDGGQRAIRMRRVLASSSS
ncbi:MAG: GNAT family N-acetyltransferase [Deltaproteobacteria bacterium]|nr:GNAT family N-acetyltransferase [Deltaproteobacteria bacterium]